MFAGDLADFALPAVLGVLAKNDKTGLLEVTNDGRPGGIELVDGRIRAATADRRRSGLARRLLAGREVGATELMGLLAADGPFPSDLRLAELLVAGSHLPDDDVAAVLREHTIDAVLELVRAREGDFRLLTQRPPESASTALSLAVDEVCNEVDERRRRIARLQSAALRWDTVVALDITEPKQVMISGEGWQLLALIDGRRTVGELIPLSGGVEATYRRLAELLGVGAVTTDPTTATLRLLDSQEQLMALEQQWGDHGALGGHASPVPAIGVTRSGSARGTAEHGSATVTRLDSRDPQRRIDTGPGLDERTLRRFLAGVEALP